MIEDNKQAEMGIEDRLEAAYSACQIPVEEIYNGLKEAIFDYLESMGFMVELIKREGTPSEKVLKYFFLDRMLSYEQVRNGIIRNLCETVKYVECKKSIVRINMMIAEKTGLSYSTIEEIRWRKR